MKERDSIIIVAGTIETEYRVNQKEAEMTKYCIKGIMAKKKNKEIGYIGERVYLPLSNTASG